MCTNVFVVRFVFNLKRLLSKVGIRGALGTAAARIVQVPDPTTADADDKWDVTTTITENP